MQEMEEQPIERLTTNQSFIPLTDAPTYRVYKRRWIGLVTLMLMNIMISWGYNLYALTEHFRRLPLTEETWFLSFNADGSRLRLCRLLRRHSLNLITYPQSI